MGEIDDNYNSDVALLDSNFLEELKASKNTSKSLEEYRGNLKKLELRFYNDYEKFNTKERRRLSKLKVKIEKDPDFKHLEIKHFDFEFNFWEKFLMRLNLFWFRFVRSIKHFVSWAIPSFVIYYWAKFRYFFKSSKRDSSQAIFVFSSEAKKLFVSQGLFILTEIRRLWIFISDNYKKFYSWLTSFIEQKRKLEVEGEEKEEKGSSD